LIPDIIKSIKNNTSVEIRNPQAVRPWKFVLDPLNGYLLLAEKLWKYGPKYAEGWNFGPNYRDIKSVSYIMKKFTQLWGDKINFKSNRKLTSHETNYLKLDCTKAKTKLGWKPKMNLDLALKYTVEWYKKLWIKAICENLVNYKL